jgi:hypothetical protein
MMVVILEKIFLKKIFIQDLAYSMNVPTVGEILGSSPRHTGLSPRMTMVTFGVPIH